jgi:hypothetical protein
MNTTIGSAGSTMAFNTPGQTAYWYSDQTWPTGSGDGGIAAGAYTLNMYFSQLPAYQTIAVDNVSSGTGTATPITVSHATGSGTDRLMLVGISGASTGPNLDVSGVTYGGVALSLVGTRAYAGYQKIWIYGLVAPATGTADVVVTFSIAPAGGAIVGVMTFTGVNQSVPLGTFASATGNSITPSVDVSSASGELVFDTVNHFWGPLTAGAGQTQRWSRQSANITGGGSTEPGASTVTMSWTAFASNTWAIGAVPIKPAAASVTITAGVYHTRADGSDPQLITSASTTITPSTSDPFAFALGSGAAQTFTAADPRRLRLTITVDSVTGAGFTLAYDSSTDPTNLSTPVITVPESAVAFLVPGLLIPGVALAVRRRRDRRRHRSSSAKENR